MTDETVTVLVEIPKGSRNKYEMDHASGRIRLDRMLFTSMQYPADYGFIEGTLGDDGDPLDALVLVGEPTFPGCEILARPVAVFLMHDEKGGDEKILTVPVSDPHWSAIERFDQVPASLRREIEHFFTVYKDLETDKATEIHGWEDGSIAWKVIEEARARAEEASRE